MAARSRVSPYPRGKRFAFTIIDDTDGGTLETVRPVYDLLSALGLRTTKTVWALPPPGPSTDPRNQGDTLERPEYADYLRRLKSLGFEIALHNVSSCSSPRSRIIAGLERFRAVMGEDPKINVHHEKNEENIHFDWARNPSILPSRFRGRLLAALAGRSRARARSGDHGGLHGQDPGSEFFWGDLCRQRIRYVRTNLFFQDLNTLKCNPRIPYALPQTPFVSRWFDASNGQDAAVFNRILSSRNIRGLKEEWGCSILYTHFGKGFVAKIGGQWDLDRATRERLEEVAGDPDGWYAPVSDVLDRLLQFQKVCSLDVGGAAAISNGNAAAVEGVTLLVRPGRILWDPDGVRHAADRQGRIVLDVLPPGVTLLLEKSPAEDDRYWYDRSRSILSTDLDALRESLLARFRARR